MRRGAGVMAILLVTASLAAQEKTSPELQRLVDTERAFANAATEKGIRDSFLEYFAEDSIAFNPAPTSATARLRSRPSRPFSEFELRWEPRLGDIAASGELGWLTGPSTFVDHTDSKSQPQHGNYLSVWRRQPGGDWRVFIDVGSDPPNAVSFAPGFTRFPLRTRYVPAAGAAPADASLLDADKALNARMASGGAAEAYRSVTTAGSRIHRGGFMPPIGTEAIAAWMGEHAKTMTATTGAAESARSGDLGYSYGTYQVTAPQAQSGAYVRVWQRDGAGKWLVVADVTQPARSPQ